MGKQKLFGKHYYEVVKSNTAKGQRLYDSLCRSLKSYGMRHLYECYDRPSMNKVRAYDECIGMLGDFNHANYATVVGYNTSQFSFGAYVTYEGIGYVMYITKDHNYLVQLED